MFYTKHAPDAVKDALGLNSAYDSVKNWVLSWEKKKNNFLIIHGASGTGKSILVDMLAKELGKEKVVLESFNNLEQFKQSSLLYTGKIIVVDDPKSVRGLSDLINESCFPVIILTNDLYKPALQTYRSKGVKVAISRPRYDSIAKLLRKVCDEEKLDCDDKLLLDIAQKCKGDVRAALLDLESMSSENRDVNDNVFNTLKIIFNSYDEDVIREAVNNCDKPLNELFWWIENNIFRSYKNPNELATAYEYLALADLYNSRIMKRQNWSLMKYLNSLAVMGVAFSKKPRSGFGGFIRYMPPMARSRRKKLDPVKHKIARKMHTTTKKADSYIPIVKELVKKNKDLIAQEFNFDKDDLKLLK